MTTHVSDSDPSAHVPPTQPAQSDLATLVTRLVDLLHAPVLVIDAHGAVVAGSSRHGVGVPIDTLADARHTRLRLPATWSEGEFELVIGESEHGEVITPRLARAFVELVINQPSDVKRPVANREQRKDWLIRELLHDRVFDEAAILREAKRLRLNTSLPRAVMLVDARHYVMPNPDDASQDGDAAVQRRATIVIECIVDCLRLPNDSICAHLGNGEIAVLKASNTRNLSLWAERPTGSEPASPSWTNLHALKRAGAALATRLQRDTGTSMCVGLGRYHPGIAGLARSYQDAQAALSLGQRFHQIGGVYCLDDLGVAAFVGVSDERTKIELARHLLSPLNHAPELLETLLVFFEHDCLPSNTARKLAIHRNTLSHRLDKITALTGLDPRRFDEALQIRLALLLRDLGRRE